MGGAGAAEEACETMGTCGGEPGLQAELLLPAQQPPCQLDAGGWARGRAACQTHTECPLMRWQLSAESTLCSLWPRMPPSTMPCQAPG